MFITPVTRLSKKQVVALAENKAKMNSMVDQVSTFLADMLCLHDDMHPRRTLVQLCHEELCYLPSRRKMLEMCALDEAARFVSAAHALATDVRREAMYQVGKNVQMLSFSRRDVYYIGDEIVSTGTTTTRISVGGFFSKLAREVLGHAARWLEELDRALCAAGGIERGEAATREMEPVRAHLARAIARRAALESEDLTDDDLSPRALDALMAAETSRNCTRAHAAAQADLRALQTLLWLALRPGGEEARQAVTQPAEDLCRLVDAPPPELVRQPLFQSAHLDQLRRALAPGMDAEVRVALVAFWAANHGEAASRSAREALEELRQWSPSPKTAFPSLIRPWPTRTRPSVAVPKMRFLHAPRRCIVRGQDHLRRRGLDERGVRSVRLVQAVWELGAYGAFEPGMVAAEPLAAVAMDDIITSRFASATIDKERRTNSHGVRLGRALAMMYDNEGEHADRIERACCALSRFSCDELEACFSTEGFVLPAICGALTERTRVKMRCAVDPTYDSFAADALALTLPLLELRRKRLGVGPERRVNALVDMLLTCRKAREWDPLRGALRLELGDLAAAHAHLRAALDALHEGGVLVRRVGGAAKKKVVYEFNSLQLRKLAEAFLDDS